MEYAGSPAPVGPAPTDTVTQLAALIQHQATIHQQQMDALLQLHLNGHGDDTRKARRPTRKTPPFKGDRSSLGTWLLAMESDFKYYNITTDDSCISHATGFLEGSAHTWWFGIVAAASRGVELLPDTWEAFKDTICLRFQRTHEQHALHDDLRALHQQGTLDVYVEKFQSLLSQINDISEMTTIQTFVTGLKSLSRRELTYRRPNTLTEAIKLAQDYDAALASTGTVRDRSSAMHHRSSAMPRFAPQVGGADPASTVTPMELHGLSVAQREQYMREGRCFLCAQTGHRQRFCPKSDTRTQRSSRSRPSQQGNGPSPQ